MIEKIMKRTVFIPEEIDVIVYETKDGRYFKDKKEAEEHEKVKLLKRYLIESKLLDDNSAVVYFENGDQVEAYEQSMCGNKEDNTWGSWVSCKEKFNFPCWIFCNYKDVGDGEYSAQYTPVQEMKKDLLNIIKQIDKITNKENCNIKCLNCEEEFHLDTFCKGDECKECGGILAAKEEIL